MVWPTGWEHRGGKIANLTVVDGDWFQERAKVRMVIIDGVKYEPVTEEEEDKSK
jgi:hypothetical protein